MTAPIIVSYQNWLKSKSYSEATIRNYLADLKKYFLFTNSNVDQVTDKIFDQDNLSSYFQNINQDSNYKRFLASLSKFFQFALDQHLISVNPFSKALKVEPEIDLEDVIKLYQQQLETKNFSLSTIRNYINDIHQFINWAQNESRPVKEDVTK
ncbi:MAG: site-specific integrase [Candidatus Shapirobacteria bacterium]|nr:site-specific integrase [Candidatus Shapirobacteria bacterium]MDD3002947.1 site-specific integrase [Candidatus Shapirobacteria bacterium]MDD4382859.1 site-specific integrase [Candidatus Shapirobacteria bacterium]